MADGGGLEKHRKGRDDNGTGRCVDQHRQWLTCGDVAVRRRGRSPMLPQCDAVSRSARGTAAGRGGADGNANAGTFSPGNLKGGLPVSSPSQYGLQRRFGWRQKHRATCRGVGRRARTAKRAVVGSSSPAGCRRRGRLAPRARHRCLGDHCDVRRENNQGWHACRSRGAVGGPTKLARIMRGIAAGRILHRRSPAVGRYRNAVLTANGGSITCQFLELSRVCRASPGSRLSSIEVSVSASMEVPR